MQAPQLLGSQGPSGARVQGQTASAAGVPPHQRLSSSLAWLATRGPLWPVFLRISARSGR